MDESVPPRFIFDGPGRWSECCNHLNYFAVEEVIPNVIPFEGDPNVEQDPHIMWKIAPLNPDGGDSQNIPVITYGMVPEGWQQIFPKEGKPQSLLEGRKYVAGYPHYISTGTLVFKIENGKAIWIKPTLRN